MIKSDFEKLIGRELSDAEFRQAEVLLSTFRRYLFTIEQELADFYRFHNFSMVTSLYFEARAVGDIGSCIIGLKREIESFECHTGVDLSPVKTELQHIINQFLDYR